jgi:hypothetical protein
VSEDRQPAADGQEPPSTPTGKPTPPGAGARGPGRRGFLVGAGGLAAAALVGAGWSRSGPTTAGPVSPTPPVGSGSGLDLAARRARALQLRLTTARQQLRDPFPQPAPNGDEDRYDVVGLATFTKALPHNPLGEASSEGYERGGYEYSR